MFYEYAADDTLLEGVEVLASFRRNIMRLNPNYTHQEFDRDIEAMMKEGEITHAPRRR